MGKHKLQWTVNSNGVHKAMLHPFGEVCVQVVWRPNVGYYHRITLFNKKAYYVVGNTKNVDACMQAENFLDMMLTKASQQLRNDEVCDGDS